MEIVHNNNICIVAELAQAHDGSLGMAHAYIDSIASSGASAVKFQTHIAEEESTLGEKWRVKFSPQDESRYEYWKRMEFTESQWIGLKRHAEDAGLLFLSSPFSIAAVQLLESIGIAMWKVPSGELKNIPLLERMAQSRIPFLLSTGMNALADVDRAVKFIQEKSLPLTVLQCTSEYPCPPERIGLNMLEVYENRYGCQVGLSDHSGTIYPALAATVLGASVVEVHVTFSREMFGPDVSASITMDEMRQLVRGVRFIEEMMANPVDKNALAEEMEPLRKLFNKSVVAKSEISAGSVITEDMIALKKPGTGIPVERVNDVIGKRLKRDIEKDTLISFDDLE